MRKILMFVAALFFPVAMLACGTSDTIPDTRNRPEIQEEAAVYRIYGVPVKGAIDSAERAVMEFRASLVPMSVWSAVNSVNIVGDESHYGQGVAAHYHCVQEGDWRTGDICILPQFTRDMALWHEMFHAWYYGLNADDGGRFADEWNAIAGDVYGLSRPDDEKFPSRGLLRLYSGMDFEEDAADTFMYVYAEIYGEGAPYNKFRTPGAVTPDPRYEAKVELLRRHGVLTDEVYHRFTDLDLFRQ